MASGAQLPTQSQMEDNVRQVTIHYDYHVYSNFPEISKPGTWTQQYHCGPDIYFMASRKHAYMVLTPLNPTFI